MEQASGATGGGEDLRIALSVILFCLPFACVACRMLQTTVSFRFGLKINNLSLCRFSDDIFAAMYVSFHVGYTAFRRRDK